MQESLFHLFKQYPEFAFIISIFVSVLIAIIGVVPSVFITAVNIIFFGVVNGTIISFTGEAIGAGIAFILYRKGFKKKAARHIQKYASIKNLIDADNKNAFYLILSFRLIPFIPSGLITFAAAVGKVSFLIFLVASCIGKLPALIIEAFCVYEVTKFDWQGKLILVIITVGFIYWITRKK